MKYTFCVGTYDAPELENEVALALDARSSLGFRKRGAKPSARKPVKEPSASGRKASKVIGIALIVLGAAALLYVMTQSVRPKLLQIAGFALLGIGLVVMRSGAPASGPAQGTMKSRQKAERLLAALRQSSFAGSLQVHFDDEQMRLATASSDLTVAYKEIHSIIETEHLWFLSYGAAGVVLLKRDLTEGDPARFLADAAAISGCSTEIVYWDETPETENTTDAPTGSDDAPEAETTGEAL